MNKGLPGINKIYRLYIAYRKMLYFHWTETSWYAYYWSLRYLSHDSNDLKCPLSGCSSIGSLSNYSWQCDLLVVVFKIKMFFLEKLRMEVNRHLNDVTDIDIFNLLYHAKMTYDT